jgi:putative addiction module component (TIGR02574 family)
MGGSGMLSNTLAALLKLPANDRIELALALWESLTDAEREAEFELTSEQEAELDRRIEEHLANPGSAIPWEEVRRKLASEETGEEVVLMKDAAGRVIGFEKLNYSIPDTDPVEKKVPA